MVKPCYRCKERPRMAQRPGSVARHATYCVECLRELHAAYKASHGGQMNHWGQPSIKKLREMATYPRDKK